MGEPHDRARARRLRPDVQSRAELPQERHTEASPVAGLVRPVVADADLDLAIVEAKRDVDAGAGRGTTLHRSGTDFRENQLEVVERVVAQWQANPDPGQHGATHCEHVRVGRNDQLGDERQVSILHHMHGTVSLRLTDSPARGEIARHAVIVLAVRVGMPPVAADRAGTAVGAAVRACPAGLVTMTATLDGASVLVVVEGGDEAWCAESAAALGAFGALAEADRLSLTLRRTPLRPV